MDASETGKRRAAIVALAAGCLALGAVGLQAAGGAQAQGPRRGAEVYASACRTCHGTDGAGSPRAVVGFDLPLPDFSWCTFSSREPNPDWYAIVHEGGPARGFDRLMPAFGDALTREDIERALDHVRAFCRQRGWPRGDLNLPRALATEKAYPEDEAVFTTTIDAEGDGAVNSKIVYEHRFGKRSQFEAIVPLPSHRADDGWTGGIGDVAFGAKSAVYHNLESGTIVSVAGEVILPTGNRDKGLGKGVTIIEPFVSVGQILPGDAFLQFQGGAELPVDTTDAAREAFWRAVVGKSVSQGAFGRTWSPMIEILGARELVDDEKVQWDLLPQVQVTLSTRQHVMFDVGVKFPLTDADRRPVQLVMYVLWDWFDGGLLEGW